MTIHDVCDYVIMKLGEAGSSLSLLKLQKLAYYTKAWHLAIYPGNEAEFFNGEFQAWIHGPVNRELYDRFKDTKSLYSSVTTEDMRADFNPDDIPTHIRQHIDAVLDVYAPFSGAELEQMTHDEEPWVKAREGYKPTERCERVIDQQLMASYYRARLQTK